MKKRFALVALALVSIAALAVELRAQDATKLVPRKRVLLISLDGLRPEVYTDARFEMPNLRAIAARGLSARRVIGVFPTVTYPSHTTIVTGCRPARHGIVANTLFDPRGIAHPRWYWESAHLQATTLWDAVKAKGGHVASVRWPVTVGAAIEWNIAEAFDADPASNEHARIMKAACTPGLLDEVWPVLPADMRDDEAIDKGATEAMALMLARKKPDLALIHLIQADGTQHRYGRDDEHVVRAFANLDQHVGRLVRALEVAGIASETCVVVTGDHGFRDLHTRIRPNVILRDAGLVTVSDSKIADWQVLSHGSGGACAIYARDVADKATTARALEALRAAASGRYKGIFTVLDRARLDEEEAFPGAIAALDSEAGYAFEDEASGTVLAPTHPGGTHGALPTHEELATGLVAAGPGLAKGRKLPVVRQVDVAPLIAHLLGCEKELGPGVEGVLVPGMLGPE